MTSRRVCGSCLQGGGEAGRQAGRQQWRSRKGAGLWVREKGIAECMCGKCNECNERAVGCAPAAAYRYGGEESRRDVGKEASDVCWIVPEGVAACVVAIYDG